MSNHNVCEIDASQLYELFDRLDIDSRKEAMNKALMDGAKVLQKNTQSQLLRKMPTANDWMVKGVKIKKDKDYTEVEVNIKGYFLLWIFENGTKARALKKDHPAPNGKLNRTLKKGESRGKVGAKHFFAEARQNDTEIIEAIEQSLKGEINKLLK